VLLKPELGDWVLDWLDVTVRVGVSVGVIEGVEGGEGVEVRLEVDEVEPVPR
jgi:hypothetical protein